MKTEKILRIEETSFKKPNDRYTRYDGYQVITNKQTIKLGMDMHSGCCEQPGYFWSADNLEEWIGAEIKSVEVVNDTINKAKFDKETDGFYEGGTMYVNINTDRGILQFTAYNEHNGYYGHDAIVMSDQLTKEDVL